MLNFKKKVLISFLLSLFLAFIGLYAFRISYHGYTTELQAIIGSWVVAIISLFPLLFYAWHLSGNKAFKIALILWLPLKFILFLFVEPSFITISADGPPLHNIYGIAVSDYWNNGGSLIPPQSFFQSFSIIYPAAIYLIGGPYYIFGEYCRVVYPWQLYFQFLCGILIYFCFKRSLHDDKMDQKIPVIGFLYTIYSPLWLYITSTLLRDVLLILAMLLTLLGIKKLLFFRKFSGTYFLIAGCFLTAFTRAQYLLLYILFLAGATILLRRHFKLRHSMVGLFLIVLIGAFVYLTPYMFLPGQFRDTTEIFLRNLSLVGQTEGVKLTALFGPIQGLGAPVAVLFRIIGASITPFPWYRENIIFSAGGSVAALVLHIIGSCLRIFFLGLFILALLRLRRTLRFLTNWGKSLFWFEIIFLLTVVPASPNYIRYLAPFYILIFPIISMWVTKKRVWAYGLITSVNICIMLHIGYEVLHYFL